MAAVQTPSNPLHAPTSSSPETRKPAKAGFLSTYITSTHRRRIKPTPLHHRKHIRHVLDHDPGGVGDGIDVVLGVVGHFGTGYQVQVGECGIEALAGAGVQLAERGVAVDQQDRVVGCGLGHGGEAAGRVLSSHGVNPQVRRITTGSAAKQIGWQLCAGSQTGRFTPKPGRPEGLPRTTAIKHSPAGSRLGHV